VSYKVNFLPPHLQVEGVYDIPRLVRTVALVGCIGVLVLGYGVFLGNLFLARIQLDRLKQEKERIRVHVEEARAVRNERERLEQALHEIQKAEATRLAWSQLLRVVASSCPAEIRLSHLEGLPGVAKPGGEGKEPQSTPFSKPGLLKIRGVTPSFVSIGVFQRNLMDTGLFKEVRLVKVGSEKDLHAFEMEVFLKEGGR